MPYVEEGHAAPPRPTKARRAVVARNDAIYGDNRFRDFWTGLSQPSRYRIHVDTDALVASCVERLNNDRDFHSLKPVIVVERGEFVVTEFELRLVSIAGGRGTIEIESSSTTGARRLFADSYSVRNDLAKLCDEPRLRGFKIVDVVDEGSSRRVIFSNREELHEGGTLSFQSEAGQVLRERTQLAPEHKYPVFNLVDRAARETGLTRRTANAIFRKLSDQRSSAVFMNPEGFAGWFISVIRNALADHVVDRMEFVVADADEPWDLDKLFPPSKEFPQKELVTAGPASLYDQVQIDSEVEARFVSDRLQPDERVICYFKFPPSFQVPLPKVVGSYNPDWGILRHDDQGQVLLQLVRETKGAVDPRQLQFPHERRKVKAAKKHFRELGVDYRVVTDETVDWWLPDEDAPELPK